MEFAQETKPKIKNIMPMSKMEIWVSRWLKELTGTALFIN
jgi:hypothetical protein